MAILKIARMGHPVLLQMCEPVPNPGAPEIRRLVADMIETMEDAPAPASPRPRCMCRCACSCSASRRRAAARIAEDTPVGNTVVINPEIELLTEDRVLRWEGCLSIPGLRAAVPRAPRIRYRGVDCDGSAVERDGVRLPCRRGAARIRPSGRHPVPDAHDRISRCSASPRNWRAPLPRSRKAADGPRTRAQPGARCRHRRHAAERPVRRLDPARAAHRAWPTSACRPTTRNCCFPAAQPT